MGTQPSSPAGAPPAATRKTNIALIYQEAITAIVRLRSNRQRVPDAATFRNHMLQLLRTAEQEARARGYTGEDTRLTTFAVVAFLDESVLNLRNPIFADWHGRPVQEELFGGHMAGEIFFQSLDRLLGRGDSEDLADVLEVYYLCLLLGYRGRYGIGGLAELRAIMGNIVEKMRRVRGDTWELAPDWAPPLGPLEAPPDPWFKRLLIAAAACFALTVLLFITYHWSLSSGVREVQQIVVETRA